VLLAWIKVDLSEIEKMALIESLKNRFAETIDPFEFMKKLKISAL